MSPPSAGNLMDDCSATETMASSTPAPQHVNAQVHVGIDLHPGSYSGVDASPRPAPPSNVSSNATTTTTQAYDSAPVDPTFSQFAHSSRTNLQSLMSSAPPKAIDWTALRAEQLQHYQRLGRRRSSGSHMDELPEGGIHDDDDGDNNNMDDGGNNSQKPGQNASWGDVPPQPPQNINTCRPGTYTSTTTTTSSTNSGHTRSMPSPSPSSASANAFLSILNSSSTLTGGTSSSAVVPATGAQSYSHARGGLTLTRRPSSNTISSSHSPQRAVSVAVGGTGGGRAHQSQPNLGLSRVRSDQWLDYRRRLEAATGVPMRSKGNGGMIRSASKRGLVLSKCSTSRSSLLPLAGQASQSNSARSLGSQTSASSASTGASASLSPNGGMYGAGGVSNMIRGSSFCKKMSLRDTPLK